MSYLVYLPLPGAVLRGALVDEALVGTDQKHGVVVGVERNAAAAIWWQVKANVKRSKNEQMCWKQE